LHKLLLQLSHHQQQEEQLKQLRQPALSHQPQLPLLLFRVILYQIAQLRRAISISRPLVAGPVAAAVLVTIYGQKFTNQKAAATH
jgi:hypothetical protein